MDWSLIQGQMHRCFLELQGDSRLIETHCRSTPACRHKLLGVQLLLNPALLEHDFNVRFGES